MISNITQISTAMSQRPCSLYPQPAEIQNIDYFISSAAFAHESNAILNRTFFTVDGDHFISHNNGIAKPVSSLWEVWTSVRGTMLHSAKDDAKIYMESRERVEYVE